MFRLIGALVVVALLAAPAVAQERMFCRYTGTEIADCAKQSVSEQSVPEQSVIEQEGCCERRVVPALGATRTPGTDQLQAPPPLAIIEPGAGAFPVREPVPRQRSASAAGPPLFLCQRALLI
jgi:hypothetical protein